MQQIKILYIEDYDLVLFTVKQLLELENWHVEICRDGAAALKKIENDGHYDLIILDDQLPVVSGLVLIQRVRELTHRRRTPIIMFTTNSCKQEALTAGANAFLIKPSGLKDLIETCNRLMKTDQVDEENTADLPISAEARAVSEF